MSWEIVQKTAYLADFVELNKNLQQLVIKGLMELENDPITPRGNTIKKLKGYENVWRYRLGGFRLIYAVAPEAELIQLLAIGPRGKVYERFNLDGWDAPDMAVKFGPQLAKQVDWESRQREWSQSKTEQIERKELPRRLTPALLAKWRIDPAYYNPLMRCLYDDDLVNLPSDLVPADVLGRVMDGLYPAPVERIASQPDYQLLDVADLAAFVDGSLSAFLLKLDTQQKPLVNWALKGPTLVKGGPGSGKSTVALYRIRALVEQSAAEGREVPSVLFTTYTNALTKTSESLLHQLLRDQLNLAPGASLPKAIRITTLHKTAIWIARHSGKEVNIASINEQRQALTAAQGAVPVSGIVSTLRPDYLLSEFGWVIEGQNCQSEADYLAASRVGRSIALGKSARQQVWHLYEAYRDFLRERNKYTWESLLQFALAQVQSGVFAQRWQHVVVDEAQDLPPVGVALCLELCESPTGLFLTADANQSLYNKGFRWGQVHENLNVQGRTRILRRNYRSTEEIAVAAQQIMAADPEHDAEAADQQFLHSGPPPVIFSADGSAEQARWIARNIFEAAKEMRLPVNSAVVLVHSSSVGEVLADALTVCGLPAKFMASRDFDLTDPAVKVTTLYAAKGLEFPIVTLAHVEAGRLPRDLDGGDSAEMVEHVAAQRKLFYVGCTRAMRYLFVTHDKAMPSPFLSDLTDDCWMFLGES
jgi:superfamily I DNA/RNA helicase/mRNA-degrading endonuclease RelE of RelBE toxin-antitoxin system